MQYIPGSKDDILKIVPEIAQKVEDLVRRTIGRELPITYLTIFAQNQHEYDRFVEWASELGTRAEANNGLRFALKVPIETVGGSITSIRIRKPDPERPQLGCADVRVDSYAAFKAEELPKHPDNLKLIQRREYDMIEFRDAGDVLAYVLSN